MKLLFEVLTLVVGIGLGLMIKTIFVKK